MTSAGVWSDEADAAIARVQGQVAAARERAEAASRVRRELDAVRGRARSRGGEVEVVSDVTGRVVDLRFSDDALDLAARDLSRLTVETIARARQEAGAAALSIAQEGFGADSSAVAALAAELARDAASGVDGGAT